MKKILKKFILIAIIVGIAFVYAHVDKNYYLYDRNQDTSEYLATGVLKEESISQEFIAESDKIDGIKIKSTVTGNVSDVIVAYQFIEKSSGKILAQGTIPGREFENSKFYQIDFDEIQDTKGKTYEFFVTETGADDMNGIGFSIATKNGSKISNKLIVKGNEIEGALAIKIIRQGFDLETFFVFLLFVAYIVMFMKGLYKLFE